MRGTRARTRSRALRTAAPGALPHARFTRRLPRRTSARDPTALALGPPLADRSRKLTIACFFHDLEIWADATFDYLEPSARRTRASLAAQGLAAWADEVRCMITEHHKLTSAPQRGPLVEAFRRADWIDVSLGLLRFGRPRAFVTAVREALPKRGFHCHLVRPTLRRTRRHPLSPLPMFQW